MTTGWHRDLFKDDADVLNHACGGGYTPVPTCQKSSQKITLNFIE